MVQKQELLELVGHDNAGQEMDIRLVVLDAIRQKMDDTEIEKLFWENLHRFSLEDIKGYFYRKR